MMLKELLFLALVALCASKGLHMTGKTADMDFLHKQKKIYELLFFVKQNTLTDMEFYEIGRNYNIETNMDMYNNKVPKLKFEDGKCYLLENKIKTSEESQFHRYSLNMPFVFEFLHIHYRTLFINLSFYCSYR